MATGKKDLVIVESPAKARTIGKYLGNKYRVTASMGHLRDLPKSKLGVDIENDFEPVYIPVKGREDIIQGLRDDVEDSGKVYLAMDPDREGEAIAWHLKELLELPDDRTYRVTFNEISKDVVNDSIEHPRAIDQDLVDAQQARRVLDRVVGYQLSPLLWRKIRRGLSAGRVQSVVTRIVCDREEEIRGFIPEEYWHLDVLLDRVEAVGSFKVRYHGDNGKKLELTNAAQVEGVIADIQRDRFYVKSVNRSEKKRSPAPPFITSTLQQEASSKLNMTPRRTMSVAQQLYEGVDITGEGTVGLITYMRTDSLRISDEALAGAGEFIKARYGAEYYNGAPRRFKSKNTAQDAHEAIRPSNITLTPEDVRKDLTSEQYRLYRLIWSRFTASQMSNAIYDNVAIEAWSGIHEFRANHSSLKFAGYTAVYDESREEEKEAQGMPLPDLREGEGLEINEIEKEQKFTQPPSRYTEATLVRTMEEKGIGRPSTYAPTVSTILDREYVVKEGRYLRPTPLGETVTKLMIDRFSDIVDTKFTARMEDMLDEVESGQEEWHDVLRKFYTGFSDSLESAEKALEGERIKVPDEVSEEVCDVCGKQMVIKSGRFGRFLACPGYPECTFTKPLVVEMPGRCPRCGQRILKRTSAKGYTYYACEKLKECGFMTWDVPVKDDCPFCGQTMFKKSGRGYKRPFCINEQCENFTPEEKRGGYKKKTAEEAAGGGDAEAKAEEKAAMKKTSKTTVKKSASATKKSAAKKTTAKKPTAKKSASSENTAVSSGEGA